MSKNSFDEIDVTTQALTGRLEKRLRAISGKSKTRPWVLEEVSRGWSDDAMAQLSAVVKAKLGHGTLSVSHAVCDVEQLRSFGFQPVPRFIPGRLHHSRALDALRKPDFGMAVAINVPVLCTGAGYYESMHNDFKTRCLIGNDAPPPYVRLAAHGPTFGTVLVKTIRKRFVDRKFLGPELIKTVTVCNNCLDLFVGELDDRGQRVLNCIPEQWLSEQNSKVDGLHDRETVSKSRAGNKPSPHEPKKSSPQKVGAHRTRQPSMSGPKKGKPDRGSGKLLPTDERYKSRAEDMTVKELKTRLRKKGLTLTGLKADLVERFLLSFN